MKHFTLIAYKENSVLSRRSCVVERTNSQHEIFYSDNLLEIANRVVEVEANEIREHRDREPTKKFHWDRSSWEMTVLCDGRPLGDIGDDFTADQEIEAGELESFYHQTLQELRNHYTAECERQESVKQAEEAARIQREKEAAARAQTREEIALLKRLRIKYGETV